MTPDDPIPLELFRWIEMQFAMWKFATERYNETRDERWLIAMHGSRLVLRPLLDSYP